MILAPNRQQPLSGNRLLWVILIPIVLVSCGAFKKTQITGWPEDDVLETKDREVVITTPPKNPGNVTGNEDKVDKKEEVLAYTSVYFKGEKFKVPVHKKSFEIAILLPFHSDASNSALDRRRADLMLEYYQGMQLAIGKIEQLDSRFTLRFFDTDNDTNQLKELLKKPELEAADLIIGPTDEEQIKIAAYFARKHEIPLLSPITVVEKLWSNNPFLFNLNPSDQMQAQDFLRYFKTNHPGEKLLIVRDGKRYDLSFGEALVQECKAQKINFGTVAFARYLKWSDHLGAGKTVVVHTSLEKTNISYSVTGLLGKGDRITLVGPEKWLDFNEIDYKQWSKINVTFISTNKALIPSPQSNLMVEQYRILYKGEPSWYTYMGYDQLLFTCEALDAFGKYFPLFLTDKSVSYSNTDFHLVKTANCFQNRYLQVFKFEDMVLIPVANY